MEPLEPLEPGNKEEEMAGWCPTVPGPAVWSDGAVSVHSCWMLMSDLAALQQGGVRIDVWWLPWPGLAWSGLQQTEDRPGPPGLASPATTVVWGLYIISRRFTILYKKLSPLHIFPRVRLLGKRDSCMTNAASKILEATV